MNERQEYVLVDLAGGIEDRKTLTAKEAKTKNEFIFFYGDRFIKWIPANEQFTIKFGHVR